MRRLNVYLDGPVVSGRYETMQRIDEGRDPPRRWEPGAALSISFEAPRVHLEVRTRVRPSLWYDLIDDADQDSEYAAQRDFIAAIDVLVFVVDSQRARLDDGRAYFEYLRKVLVRLGRDPDEVPVVFQLNKRDVPNVASEAELRGLFQSRRSAYVATVAKRGDGIPTVVAAAIELCGAV